VRWRLPEPFCTFDYRACCRAFETSGAVFIRVAAHGHRGAVALTSAGEIPAGALVDATGWRTALAGRAGDRRSSTGCSSPLRLRGSACRFTGEGICSAVWARHVCGGLVRRRLDGELSATAVAVQYAAYVERQRRRYRVLEWSTLAALRLPARVLGVLEAVMSWPGPLRLHAALSRDACR
jgi:hypothetical protein